MNYQNIRTKIKKYQYPFGVLDKNVNLRQELHYPTKFQSGLELQANVDLASMPIMNIAPHVTNKLNSDGTLDIETNTKAFRENVKLAQDNGNAIAAAEAGMRPLDISTEDTPTSTDTGTGDPGPKGFKFNEGAAVGVAQGFQAADAMLMGDKNFGAQSQAIDTVVHGASSMLLKSGNPYAMAAGAALEVGNFITKAGGQTVEGFDVDINSSGYGDLGHQESQANRVWDSGKRLAKQLQTRNEQIQLSLKAQNIAEEQQFENEANVNSVTNTIMANQQALAGGYDTSLLGG